MKCRYLKDVHEPRSQYWGVEGTVEKDGRWYWPAGTIEDHPRAYMLVRMGTAEPADEECEMRANMSAEQMAIAQRNARAVAKGIHPQDYQKFFDGVIDGYNDDGTYQPGINWTEEALEE